MTGRSTMIEDLPAIDVLSREFTLDPHRLLGPLQAAQHSLARSPRGLEVISHAACQELLANPELRIAKDELAKASGITEGMVLEYFETTLPDLEGAAHNRVRKTVAPYFSKVMIDESRAAVRTLTREWLTDEDGSGEIEFVDRVARRLPATMFCLLAGLPVSEWEMVARLSAEAMKVFHGDPQYRDTVLATYTEMDEFVRDLVASRALEPGSDLISYLLEAEARAELSHEEVVNLTITLMAGSGDTTQSQFAHLIAAFAENPDQWELLKREPEHLPAAVQEGARYAPGIWSYARYAPVDSAVDGIRFPAGSWLYVDVIAANWDPAIYEQPERFDIKRGRSRPPLNWGKGHHFCVGRALATMEMEEALHAVLDSWESFELAGEFETSGEPDLVSAERLPLSFNSQLPRKERTRPC